jgi:hypothetical protein
MVDCNRQHTVRSLVAGAVEQSKRYHIHRPACLSKLHDDVIGVKRRTFQPGLLSAEQQSLILVRYHAEGRTIPTLVTQAPLSHPTSDKLWIQAKQKAKEATRQGTEPQTQLPRVKSTTLNVARAKRGTTRSLPENVGKLSKRVDTALPAKHTRNLYDQLTRREASVLAQLRTGMARLNSYLFIIKAAPSDQCDCGQARETVEHFLFRCRRWAEHQTEMLQCTDTHRSNILFYLGGKSPSDDKNWVPDMKAVRATIQLR